MDHQSAGDHGVRGAFMAGRLSLGHLAQVSRHGAATLRSRRATRGAVAVLAIALVLPGFQDTLVVATMLAAPVAFVLGTFRPKHVQESSYNWRGIAIAIGALALALNKRVPIILILVLAALAGYLLYGL